MKVALTGATGQLGHWIAAHLLAQGHEVLTLGRRPSRHRGTDFAPYELGGDVPPLKGCDVLVHAALDHAPGRYRGGEGDDPSRFVRRNLDGSVNLFRAARGQGVGRILFLSSRAVYGAHPPGTALDEALSPKPDTLYGRIKHDAEQALAALTGPDLTVASLRATGVYGPPVPGHDHKWQQPFAAFARGERLAARAGTELHALDLASAVLLLAQVSPAALADGVFNLSDFVLDRRDLLAVYARESGIVGQLPEPADPGSVSAMTTARIKALGWRPRGPGGVAPVVAALVAAERAGSVA